MERSKLIRNAFILAIITVVYNVFEGLASVFFGASDETLALFGFGIDSFVEVISGAGILHMIVRMKKAGAQDVSDVDRIEKQALMITGTAFYLLTAGLVVSSALSLFLHKKPETTLAGIIISAISIFRDNGRTHQKRNQNSACAPPFSPEKMRSASGFF